VNTIMRTASVVLPLSQVLFASVAFSAEPTGQAAPAPAPATSNNWVNPPAPVTTANPAVNSPAPTTAPANSAQPDAPSPASSLAPSPYDTANPSPSPSDKVKLATPPAAEKKVADDGPPTLLGKAGDYAFGGFGGVGVQYTRFAGKNAVQVCGEGAVIIDHALTLGGGGCGITTNPNAEQYGPTPHDPNDRLMFGYGGAIIRYHLFSRSLINLGVGALIGAGGLTIGTWNNNSDGTDRYTRVRSEAVFVFEPQVGGYTNVTRWLRVGITGGYRIVSGVSMPGLSSGDVSSPVIGGVVQGGWF